MSTTEGGRPQPTPLSLHVLVVDDEFLIRWSLVETLAEEGHRVAEAGDGETALKTLGSDDPFDVVLLDYHLPDSHDLTLLATIRRLAPQAVVIDDDGVRHAGDDGPGPRAWRLPGRAKAV